jgi:hypothetical protein
MRAGAQSESAASLRDMRVKMRKRSDNRPCPPHAIRSSAPLITRPRGRAQKQIQLEFDHTLAVATAARAAGCKACHLGAGWLRAS